MQKFKKKKLQNEYEKYLIYLMYIILFRIKYIIDKKEE